MVVTLEDLKKGNGKVNLKEFKFLTPLSDILEKEYGKDVLNSDKMTLSALNEALETICKNKILAAYHTAEELIIGSYSNLLSLNKKEKEDFDFKKACLDTLNMENVLKEFGIQYGDYKYSWRSRYEFLLHEIYIVTDVAAFEDYRFELMLEIEEKEKIEISKRNEEKRNKYIKEKELAEKYGIAIKNIPSYIEDITILEGLENKDPKKRLRALGDLLEKVESIAESCC